MARPAGACCPVRKHLCVDVSRAIEARKETRVDRPAGSTGRHAVEADLLSPNWEFKSARSMFRI